MCKLDMYNIQVLIHVHTNVCPHTVHKFTLYMHTHKHTIKSVVALFISFSFRAMNWLFKIKTAYKLNTISSS